MELVDNRQIEEERFDSALGTKEYWEQHYATELNNFKDFGDEGEVWFGRSAESRMVRFVTDKVPKNAAVIDLGTGNGSVLRALRRKGYLHLTGVDYCEEAVELARRAAETDPPAAEGGIAPPQTIDFRVADVIAEQTDPELVGRFQVVLDKGTWDAISLAGDRQTRETNYVRTVNDLFELHEEDDDLATRYFVIFSCNFTREELCDIFEGDTLQFDSEIAATNTIVFGGAQGVTSTGVVFRKKTKEGRGRSSTLSTE